MSHRGLIVLRKKGKTFPLAFAEKAIKQFPSASGIAIILPAMEGNGKDELVAQLTSGLTPANLVQTSEKFKDTASLTYFGNFPEGWKPNDIQPFTTLESKDKEVLVATFIDGNFPAFIDSESVLSSAYHYHEKYLKPKMAELFDLADGDLKKLAGFCDRPTFKNDLLAAAVQFGHVTMMFQNGQMLTLTHVPPIVTDFGWTTDMCGYTEKKDEPVVDKKVDTRPAAVRRREALFANTTVIEPEKKVDEPAPSSPLPHHEIVPGKTDTAPIPTVTPLPLGFSRDEKGILFYQSPDMPGPKREKQIKKNYNVNAGFLPNGRQGSPEHYLSRPVVKVNQSKLKDFEGLGVAAALAANKGTLAPGVHAVPDKDESKVVSVEVRDVQPIISAAAKERFEDKFLKNAKVMKAVDELSTEIITPDKMQEREEKWPSVQEQMGWNIPLLSYIARYPDEAIAEIVRNHTDLATAIIVELRNLGLQNLSVKELKDLNEKSEHKPTTTTAAPDTRPAAVRRREQQRRAVM